MEELLINHLEEADEVVAKEIQGIDIVSKQEKQGLYVENIANAYFSEF